MTLTELVKDQVYPIKVTNEYYGLNDYFEIYGSNIKGFIGFNSEGESIYVPRWEADRPGTVWKLYTPPKKKVIKWLWVNKNSGVLTGYHDETFFKNNDKYIKLEWSKQEFEEL